MRKESLFTIPSERHPDLTGKFPTMGLHLIDPCLQMETMNKPRSRFLTGTSKNPGFRLFPEI